jgi:uncharacterized protein (DUF58 family)
MKTQKSIKIVVGISALAGLFLLAGIFYFSTKAGNETPDFTTENRITVDKTLHDFGTIRENGGEVSATFTIKNNAKTPLVLTHVTSSCGCTVPNWDKEPIKPGKTGKITATFNPKGRPGPFDKTISIRTSIHPDRLDVRIKGTVEKD